MNVHWHVASNSSSKTEICFCLFQKMLFFFGMREKELKWFLPSSADSRMTKRVHLSMAEAHFQPIKCSRDSFFLKVLAN